MVDTTEATNFTTPRNLDAPLFTDSPPEIVTERDAKETIYEDENKIINDVTTDQTTSTVFPSPAFKINYSDLLKTKSPIVVPQIPKENITLNRLLHELDSIENELNQFNGVGNRVAQVHNVSTENEGRKGRNYNSVGGFEFGKYRGRGGGEWNKNRKSRCSVNKSGCEHICNANGPSLCSCREGFYLADNGKNCIGLYVCFSINITKLHAWVHIYKIARLIFRL